VIEINIRVLIFNFEPDIKMEEKEAVPKSIGSLATLSSILHNHERSVRLDWKLCNLKNEAIGHV
jgi:hypothetical protein